MYSIETMEVAVILLSLTVLVFPVIMDRTEAVWQASSGSV